MISEYKRVMLKCSGELFLDRENSSIIDFQSMRAIAEEIKNIKKMNIGVCLVIGGGNIFRGRIAEKFGIPQYTGDYMGMMATIINALAMQHILEDAGMETRVMSSIPMRTVCEPYIRRRAERHLKKGRTILFAAGTGNPYFSTDTAAALRAAEMECDVILKGTNVDGVYDKDPHKNQNAKHYDKLSYEDILLNRLNVMDASAVSLARDNNIPIVVFNIYEKDNLINVMTGGGVSTIISNKD